jgi:hypothetical protein
MNAERAQAYGRVMRTLEEMGPTKLLVTERNLIREAADALLFGGEEASDGIQIVALEVAQLMSQLEESGRWTRESAAALHADIRACGAARGADGLSRAA